MSVELHVLQRVRALVESSPGADGTGDLTDYTDVPLREGTATVELQMTEVDPQTQVQSRVEWREQIPCKRTATLTFTTNIAPTGTTADAATPAVTSALGLLLKATMGGERLGQGDTAASGSTATAINVANGSRWAAGGIMGRINSDGVPEWRPIESVSGNVVTLKKAFSAAPLDTEPLFSGATYYFTENPSSTLQFLVAGRESDDRWLLLNGQCTGAQLSLDPSGGDLPTIAWTFEFINWIASDEVLEGTITGDIGDASYSAYNPIVGCGGEMRAWVVGTSAHASSDEVDASAIEFQPSLVFTKRTSPTGDRWVPGRAGPPATGSFTEPFEDTKWFNARKNRDDYAIWYAQGHDAGATIVYDAPTVQIIAPQRVAGAAGEAAQAVQWQARRDTDVGGATTELARSPLRIHVV
ncbi:hypothetical protein [Sandaracinus amylolyticus]|uniref:Uncharacterized protein n=1 Tax=Sandaracinus amylolyticus TaxID=927083 RepID=A0A0F6YKX5_9BACT|nr:hypothetical protein [Sandaracinus amylolyticus]AKF08888.1 hypothetical protein DB32_006037 [Sandaracinus amylolyticus]